MSFKMNFGRLKHLRADGETLRAVFCGLLGAAVMFGVIPSRAESAMAQQRRSRPRSQPSAQPAETVSPQEALQQARSAPTQKERVELLEKLVAAKHGGDVEREARELLMREYALRGEQHLREGNPELASREFGSVFRNVPDPVTDRLFGQFIFPLPLAMSAFGFRDQAVQLMRSFEPRFQNDANRLVQIGFFYVQIEAPVEASRVLERAVRLAPEDHRAHNSLGTAYLIGLRLEDAESQFRRALELSPNDEFANLNLANLLRASGDYEQAIEYYRRQIRLKGDDGEAHGGLAIALLAVGRDEDAGAHIKRATELAPENYRFLTQLAYFYATRRRAALGRPLVERAAQIEPRSAWTHIVKANIDSLEGRHGDALSTMIGAQALGGFVTLKFELVKALMSLDGYDQAVEVMAEAIRIGDTGEFETTLGGVVRARSPSLDLLLQRERQAAMLLDVQPTTALQYRLAENLLRLNHYMKTALAGRKAEETRAQRRGRRSEDSTTASRPRRASAPPESAELSAGADASLPGMDGLMRAITVFTTLDDGRQAFRMAWTARTLSENGLALDAAEQLARRAIDMADAATEPEGSMRDAPLLDREGRRAVFLGRAHDVLGWTLFKKGDSRGALEHLARAVTLYPPNQERKEALWHLAVATEQLGDERRALDFYIDSFDPSAPTASARRSQIEALYKKLHGSLAGLEERLKPPE